ncbi:MAG: hypothetical protein ACR2ME_06080 [Acidimicrobiia bacterium]
MPEPRLTDHQLKELSPQSTLAVRIRKAMSEIDMSTLFEDHLPKVYDEIRSRGYETAGPPFARYHEFGPEWADVEIGVPLTEAPSSLNPLDEVPLEQTGVSELSGG